MFMRFFDVRKLSKVIEIGSYVNNESKRRHITAYECVNNYLNIDDYLHFVSLAVCERKKNNNIKFVVVGPRTIYELFFLMNNLENPISIALISNFETRKLRRLKQKERKNELCLEKRDISEKWDKLYSNQYFMNRFAEKPSIYANFMLNFN